MVGAAWLAPGFSVGLAVMLALSRWSWLEMRWNTGQAWWAIMLLFWLVGLVQGKSPRAAWLAVCDFILLLVLAATVARGSQITLPAALFRDGLAWPGLRLNMAMVLITTGLLASHLIYLLQTHLFCSSPDSSPGGCRRRQGKYNKKRGK